MDVNARRFRVGAVVIGAATLFVGLIVFIAGSGVSSRMQTFYVMFDENVKGMVVGSRVNFQGVPVGTVQDIRFQNGKTRVKLSVDADKGIVQEVTRARLDRLLVTGQVTVELEGYEDGARPQKDGTVLQPKASPINQLTWSLPTVVGHVDALLVKATALLDNLNQVLSADNLRAVSGTLAHLEQTTATLPRRLDETLRAAESALSAVGDLARHEDATATLAAARRTIGKLEAVADEARGLIGGNRTRIGEVLLVVRDSLQELRALARGLRLAPSSVLFGREVEELAMPAPGGGQ